MHMAAPLKFAHHRVTLISSISNVRSISQTFVFSFLYRFPKTNQDTNQKMGRTENDDTGDQITNGTLGKVYKDQLLGADQRATVLA